MLKLDTALQLTQENIASKNLVDQFNDVDLRRLGAWVVNGYTMDKQSRAKWEKRTEAAMDLAMQIQKQKNWPWPNCSNVAFPLVTIATTQFHARAYPAIIVGPELVKYRVIGSDPKGQEKLRAERIGTHMSWQLTEEDRDWEQEHDYLLINLAVVGSNFKKSFFSGTEGRNDSELVMAKDLVMDYYAKTVEDCPRKTHVIPFFRNDIYERVQLGTFRNILEEPWYKQPSKPPVTQQTVNADNRQGVAPPAQPDETTPFIFLEQHCWLDLDQDGYAEPYIITVDLVNQCVVRIVCRFEQEADINKTVDGKIISIRALEYFTRYIFLPSPDGGIYGMGFGVLLGPLNESVNTLINQLIDAGTMSTSAGGFLGRGAKIRGGVYTFAPFSWQRVDSTGEDLQKSIFPLPVREPNMVLFQLLSLLVNYTNRISGSTDIMVGESVGQNTPADTARQMQAEGQKIYNAIFKRIWASMKEEFRKLYILNAYFMPVKLTFGVDGQAVGRADYLGDPSRVAPVADPNTTSQEDRIKQAMGIKQLAASTPGYNPEEVERNLLKALGVPNIEVIYPGIEAMPPGKDIKLQLKEMDVQLAMQKLALDRERYQSDLQESIIRMMEEQRVNTAKIAEMEAEAMKDAAGLQGEEAGRQLQKFQAIVEMLKSRNDYLIQQSENHSEMLRVSKEAVAHDIAKIKREAELIKLATKKAEAAKKQKELESAE